MESRRRARRAFAVATLGAFLVQVAWALAVPPFWGLDERDHANRAAAVARGDWATHHPPSPDDPWEALMVVPAALVEAGRPVCEHLWRVSDPDNCRPVEVLDDDSVVMSSVTVKYNPVFYFLIGAPARLVGSGHDLYAFRVAASLLCAVLVGAAVVVARSARTRWPLVALVAALTPTFWYSAGMAAPNGVEMAGGLLLWVSLLELTRRSADRPPERWLVAAATLGGVAVAVPRTLGPVWLCLIVLTMVLATPRADLARALRHRDVRMGAVVVLAAVAYGVTWTLLSGANQGGLTSTTSSPLAPEPGNLTIGMLAAFSALWLLQTVAAFPGHLGFAPVPVYCFAVLPWVVMGIEAWNAADARLRRALVFLVGATLFIPVLFTLKTYAVLSMAWQGRYALPFAVGCLLVCGYVLDRARPAPGWALWAVGGLSAAAVALSQVDVVGRDLAGQSPGLDMVHVPGVVVGALAVAGMALVVLAGAKAPRSERRPVAVGS